MKYLLAATLALTLTPIAAAQYPKTITLTVTRITRTQTDNPPSCDNCLLTVTTVEAHTDTANFVLTCEAFLFAYHPENTKVCVQFEPGTYEAIILTPEVIDFSTDKRQENRVIYRVAMEEARTKQVRKTSP
jgi:hypothetical protein